MKRRIPRSHRRRLPAAIEFSKWIIAEGEKRTPRLEEVREALDQAARRRGVDPELVKARLWAVISRLDPTNDNKAG